MRMPCDMVVGGSCSIHAATRIIFQTFLLDNVDASNICKAACALRMFKDDPEVSGAWKDTVLVCWRWCAGAGDSALYGVSPFYAPPL